MRLFSKVYNTKRIYVLVMVYLALAFGWWAYLLIQNNDIEFHNAVVALSENISIDPASDQLMESDEYLLLKKAHFRKSIMIISEGIVFILTLFFGLFLLSRSYNRELTYRTQQKNFLLSITHELRSPLASTKLVLQTIQKRKLEQVQQEELIESALVENERLNTLINDMLLAVRMEEIYDPVFERIDIKKLFDNIMITMRYKYPNIEWNISEELKEQEVIADKSGVTSIIVNLLENAAKYSNRKGDVRIVFKEYKNKLIIKVADHGVGIPDSEKKKVFERFYRVGNEDVRKSKGTGLGLYLVKKLVDIYGGNIIINDNTPKGTIFDVSLPINLPLT